MNKLLPSGLQGAEMNFPQLGIGGIPFGQSKKPSGRHFEQITTPSHPDKPAEALWTSSDKASRTSLLRGLIGKSN